MGNPTKNIEKSWKLGGELYEQGLNAKHIANLTSAGHVRVIEYIYIHIIIIKCRKHDMSSATLCNKCVFCGHFGVAGIVLPAAVPSLERC